jgi:hypothetical protein
MLTVNSANQAPGVDATTAQGTKAPAKPEPIRRAVDTAQFSAAARAAAKAALDEGSETPAQTAKEAAAGDHQAQRLLARQAAEKHAK